MRLDFERMVSRAEFGVTETVATDTLEGSKEQFVPEKKIYFLTYQRTQKQTYDLLGTDLESSIVIAVRSSKHIDDSFLVRLPGDSTIYKIVAITRGNPRLPDEFDLITILDKSKVGGKND